MLVKLDEENDFSYQNEPMTKEEYEEYVGKRLFVMYKIHKAAEKMLAKDNTPLNRKVVDISLARIAKFKKTFGVPADYIPNIPNVNS